MTSRKILLFSLLIVLFPTLLFSYNLRQLTNLNGLSNSAILSLHQDFRGAMWIGTCDGLNMFDGLNIDVYKPSDKKNRLSGNLIEKIVETESGILWTHTNYGLNKLDIKKGITAYFNQFEGTYYICKSDENDIFILQKDNSISYYNQQTKLFEDTPLDGIIFNDILHAKIDRNNILWVFSKDKEWKKYIINKANGRISFKSIESHVHSNNLVSCFSEGDLIYFVDDSYTLFEYNIETQKLYYRYNLKEEIVKNGNISSIIKHKEDYFIGFKTSGLIELKHVSEKQIGYRIEETEIKSGVFCILKDRFQDVIWIGTDGEGVYIYSDDPVSIRTVTFDQLQNKVRKPIRAIHLDKNKNLWLGTKGDGIVRIKDYATLNNVSQTYISDLLNIHNSSLIDNSVYVFAKSQKDILWLGTEKGINYFSYAENKIKSLPIDIGNGELKYIHDICEINDSILWIATVGQGVAKINLGWQGNNPFVKSTKLYTINNGNPRHNHFFSILNDDGRIWFGSRGYGIFKIDDEDKELIPIEVENMKRDQLLADIFSITKDVIKNYWFGTSAGLIKLNPEDNSSHIFDKTDGLFNNTIHAILSDSAEVLWFSTNQGIVRLDTQREFFRTYDHLNGLKVVEYSDGASFRDPDSSEIFFGGVNGFVSVIEDKSKSKDKEYLPPIFFNNISIFGEKQNINNFLDKENGDIIELKYDQNFFSISFIAIDYINGNNYSYQYLLEGMSDQWIDNGTVNTATFTNVPHGKYTLHVKYIDVTTGKESRTYSITIKITPPWYLSTMAYIIYALLFFGAIAVFIKAIENRSKKKKEALLEKLDIKHKEDVYESKLRFFTNVAHEFCTPLTLIHAPCSRILSHPTSAKAVKDYAGLIQNNATKLNTLIQELIEFRRIETGNREPLIEETNISTLINDVADSFSDLSKSMEITFEKNISSPLVWNTDTKFLQSITTNLVSNAFKYTINKGSVIISVEQGENDVITITVSNTGRGIKEEEINKIFNRYSILDNIENNEYRNNALRNGLGLAIAYNTVKLLNGDIEVKSQLNDWTHFCITLPRLEINDKDIGSRIYPELLISTDAVTPITELPDYIYEEGRQSILIIDDDIEILWMICDIFKDDYNVLPASNKSEIDALLENEYPNLIISDIIMNEMNGIELVRKIKSNEKMAHIPMILLSALHDVEKQIEALSAGAEMYLTKPFNIDHLRVSVERLLTRKKTLEEYFNSPLSAFNYQHGKLLHQDDKLLLKKIQDTIKKNIQNKDLSTQLIASELNMSTRHLYRRLKNICDDTPADMIREYRFHIVTNLLIKNKMTIDEIIYKAGFLSRGTFFKLFSAKYGCTPKEYREKILNKLPD